MEKLTNLLGEAQACLTQNILPFWLEQMRDVERGGWYGRMTGRGELQKDAERGGVLYARLLWTFSAAYRVMHDGALLEAASRAKDYIERFFMDHQYGGSYWSVTAEGAPLDTKKQTYAIGFMLYGFSEYARATGDDHALDVALSLFDVIEEHAWEPEYGGYLEAFTRDWQPLADMRLSAKDDNWPKSQNTHLHVIEPYTNLLRVLKERGRSGEQAVMARVEKAVRRLIDLFAHCILNPETHHLDLFFDLDWTRMSTTASYGHDIECSWLLHEAALVVGDAGLLSQIAPIVRAVAAASEGGLQADGSMVYESGDADRHWWVQAETVVGFVNLYQYFGDEEALTKALRCWDYVKAHLIDRERGEWFWSVRADGSVNLDDDHAGPWKCPYHNSRMCLEIMERFGRRK